MQNVWHLQEFTFLNYNEGTPISFAIVQWKNEGMSVPFAIVQWKNEGMSVPFAIVQWKIALTVIIFNMGS